MVADQPWSWYPLDSFVDLCWLAVDKLRFLGLWLALAVVVLDPVSLVYSLAHRLLVLVARLVELVDLDMVGFLLGFLALLVDNSLQRSDDLVLEKEIVTR